MAETDPKEKQRVYISLSKRSYERLMKLSGVQYLDCTTPTGLASRIVSDFVGSKETYAEYERLRDSEDW